MSFDTAAQQTSLVSRDRVIDVVRPVLRNATIVAKRFTVEQIAEMSGVPLRTVRSYMANDPAEVREPTLSNALSIACVLGPIAVNGVLALIGYGGAAPLEEGDDRQPIQMLIRGAEGWATITRCAADNRIDHVEEPDMTAAADMLIAELIPYSSAGRAA